MLTTNEVEPDDKTSWHVAEKDDFAFVRADRAKASTATDHWYAVFRPRGGPGWKLVSHTPEPWAFFAGPDKDPGSWPMIEGPSDLYDLVMREVGR